MGKSIASRLKPMNVPVGLNKRKVARPESSESWWKLMLSVCFVQMGMTLLFEVMPNPKLVGKIDDNLLSYLKNHVEIVSTKCWYRTLNCQPIIKVCFSVEFRLMKGSYYIKEFSQNSQLWTGWLRKGTLQGWAFRQGMCWTVWGFMNLGDVFGCWKTFGQQNPIWIQQVYSRLTKLEVKAKVACILAYVIFVLIYVLVNVIVANWYDCFECCCFAGPLDQFGSWGRRESVWIAVRGQAWAFLPVKPLRWSISRDLLMTSCQDTWDVLVLSHACHMCFHSFMVSISFAIASQFALAAKLGPPDQKRYTLCIYKDESSCNKGGNPEVEVELLKALGSRETKRSPYTYVLKSFVNFCTGCLAWFPVLLQQLVEVLSVQPDPARSEVFIINYLEKNKAGYMTWWSVCWTKRMAHNESFQMVENMYVDMKDVKDWHGRWQTCLVTRKYQIYPTHPRWWLWPSTIATGEATNDVLPHW